jgi:DNA-binding NarL/FixJ family response regulator
MRIGILTRVRLLSDALATSLSARNHDIESISVRTIAELGRLADGAPRLQLVLVDAIQPIDLDAIRDFHRDYPDLPLLALGLREHEADIIAHGNAGFSCYLRREDGMETLCQSVEDALAGRLNCSPEIAAAMMRALFRRGPIPVQKAGVPLTRRENQVAALVGHALSNKEIARELALSESTVKHHVHSILSKFGISTRGQLMRNMREDVWLDQPARRPSSRA